MCGHLLYFRSDVVDSWPLTFVPLQTLSSVMPWLLVDKVVDTNSRAYYEVFNNNCEGYYSVASDGCCSGYHLVGKDSEVGGHPHSPLVWLIHSCFM